MSPDLPEENVPVARGATADLVELLRSRGQRVTSQRLVILRELRERGGHVSAQELADWVRDELPGTSTPTIYATLELLTELGLVRRLDVGAGASLFDARIAPHQHMVCRSCGRIADLDVPLAGAPWAVAARASGFTPERAELLVWGLCADCGG